MKPHLLPLLLLTAAVTAIAFAQTPAKEPAPAAGSDEQIITQIEYDGELARLKQDVAALDRILAPEYMAGDASGFSTKTGDPG